MSEVTFDALTTMPDTTSGATEGNRAMTDGGLSDGSKDVLITATADQLEHKRPENLLPSEEVYWSVAGKPRQTEPGRTVWFAHDDRIHARGTITELESGYLWFDAAHKTDAPCLDDAPSRGFTYIEPLGPRLAAGGESEVRADGGSDRVRVVFQTYEDYADIEHTEHGTITNHDELVNDGQTYREIRWMSTKTADQFDMTVVDDEHSLWCDAVADLGPGESLRVDELRGESDD